MKEGIRDSEPRSASIILRLWRRIPVWLRATLIGIFVSSLGIYAWLVIATRIQPPWSIFIMAFLLWIYVKYFGGSWWPRSTAEGRMTRFRSTTISSRVWKWSLVSALLIVAIWQSGMVVTFRLLGFPREAFAAGDDLEAMPLWMAWLFGRPGICQYSSTIKT